MIKSWNNGKWSTNRTGSVQKLLNEIKPRDSQHGQSWSKMDKMDGLQNKDIA